MPGRRGLLAAALPWPALAQGSADFPRRGPIRLVVAQGPGSATDIMARLLANRMAEAIGQQFLIDNRAGAGGIMGAEIVARAPPDGYTLFIASISTHGVNPGLYRRLPYDTVADFTPIGLAATTANVVVVNKSLGISTLTELFARARQRPGTLSFATPGQGSSQHLATELLMRVAGGADMLHVPYRGTAPGLTAVVANEVQWMMPAIPSGAPLVQNGTLAALAVTGAARARDLPDVPTVAETFPGFEVTTWYGLVGPARMPPDIVAFLNRGLRTAMASTDGQRMAQAAGLESATSSPEEFGAFIRSEIAKWAEVIRAAGIEQN
jgi:tripartite-type tricarboxylate transporter receptor subunit TctC